MEFKITALEISFQSSFFNLYQTFLRQLPSFSINSQCFWMKSPFLLIYDVQTIHPDEQAMPCNEHDDSIFIDKSFARKKSDSTKREDIYRQ